VSDHDLERFVAAQDAGDAYTRAGEELRAGRKVTHWMWFVFPQIAGLGHSEMARRYAISSLDEAKAYLAHPVLGPRIVESAEILLSLSNRTARQIFGEVDAQKLCSSMTLFREALPGQPAFAQVIAHYFDGLADAATIDRLR
jgi:uncharacterized protein (DUF1810 family)